MKWNKRGVIFELEASGNRTPHAQVPTVYLKDADTIRIYYAGRMNGKSFPAWFDLDRRSFAKDKIKITKQMSNPIMPWGDSGMFDSDGIMPSCVIPAEDELRMYYIGWNEKSKTARYHNAIGVAVSHDGGDSFIQKFTGPVIDRTKDEPGLAVMPFVMYKNWYRMWYQSGTGWHKVGDQYEPTYAIKYAYSMDGIEWKRHKGECFALKDAEAVSNPSVIFRKNTYHMWYCYRGREDYRGGKNSYRIGYATSEDGISFDRKDSEAGIELSEKLGEFDSEMQCYPYVIEIDGRLCMFYNGNSFGQSGIGYAVHD